MNLNYSPMNGLGIIYKEKRPPILLGGHSKLWLTTMKKKSIFTQHINPNYKGTHQNGYY